MIDVVTIGEALIDFVPEKSGLHLADVSKFSRRFGGAPANLAVGLSRLGSDVGFIGKVGTDGFGDFIEARLNEEGVNTSQLFRTDRANTTLAFVSVAEDGEREFAFYRNPGADELLQPSEIDRKLIEGTNVLHFGSLSLTSESSFRATELAIDYGLDSDVVISMDPNVRTSLWDDSDLARNRILSLLDRVEVLKLSEEEVEFLTGKADLEAGLASLRSAGPELIAVTMGSKGSYCSIGDINVSEDGYSVSVKDTTGAGDGFMAGFLHSLLDRIDGLSEIDERELKQYIKFANATAALTTTDYGATSAFPQKEDIKKLISRGTSD